MTTHKYQQKYRTSWNNFIKQSKNGTFLLHRDFMEYHKDKFEDFSVIITDAKDNLVGVFPASKKDSKTIISHGGLTYGSLLLSPDLKLFDVVSCFASLLQFYEEQDIEKIIYKTIPSFYHIEPCFEESYVLFLLDAHQFRMDTSFVLPLTNPYRFQKRRVRSIKQAQKKGVEIKKANSFDEYWLKILTPNLQQRFGVKPVHSLQEISYLNNLFPSKILQYNAYLDNQIVAGTTLFLNRNSVHAQYISGNDLGRKSGALDYLFAYLIQKEFKEFDYFSFGISNEEEGRKINKGLADWKEGFGSKVFLNPFYEIKTKSYTKLKNVF